MALQTVDRACNFLFMLRSLSEASLSELSEASGLKRSTARGVLTSLVDHGLVYQDPVTRRYRLGTGLIDLAQGVMAADHLRLIARPLIRTLRDLTQESVGISIRVGDERVIVEVSDSENPIRHVLVVGAHTPLHMGAVGRVFLAWMPESELGDYVDRIQGSDTQAFDVKGLRDTIERIQETGISASEGEVVTEAVGIATPIRDRSNNVIAALHIAAPASRQGSGGLSEFKDDLVAFASKIERSLQGNS